MRAIARSESVGVCGREMPSRRKPVSEHSSAGCTQRLCERWIARTRLPDTVARCWRTRSAGGSVGLAARKALGTVHRSNHRSSVLQNDVVSRPLLEMLVEPDQRVSASSNSHGLGGRGGGRVGRAACRTPPSPSSSGNVHRRSGRWPAAGRGGRQGTALADVPAGAATGCYCLLWTRGGASRLRGCAPRPRRRLACGPHVFERVIVWYAGPCVERCRWPRPKLQRKAELALPTR